MKKYLIWFFLVILSVQFHMGCAQDQNDFIEILTRTEWYYSYEEDYEDYQVYRPETFDFPPSRGRVSYAFDENGKVTHYVIAPADGLLPVKGKWNYHPEENRISIRFESVPKKGYPQIKDVIMEVVDYGADKLVVKML
jgi:hypothetical protein